jgi:hypothetical protein
MTGSDRILPHVVDQGKWTKKQEMAFEKQEDATGTCETWCLVLL